MKEYWSILKQGCPLSEIEEMSQIGKFFLSCKKLITRALKIGKAEF